VVLHGGGLSRFDGYGFKNYTEEQGLPDREVNDLLETRDGAYWLATSNGSLPVQSQRAALDRTNRLPAANRCL
jgi:ligand-binding sensor domain-containing protein